MISQLIIRSNMTPGYKPYSGTDRSHSCKQYNYPQNRCGCGLVVNPEKRIWSVYLLPPVQIQHDQTIGKP